jgi:hypothetical protein
MATCPDPGKAVGVEDRMVYLGSGLFYPPFRPFQIAFLSLINAAVPPQPHVHLSKIGRAAASALKGLLVLDLQLVPVA